MSKTAAAPKSVIQKFECHMKRMQTYLDYVSAVQRIVPKLALGLSKEWLEHIREDIREVIYLTREIYNRPDLGSSPPNPLSVDPACPDYLISDHMRELLGRNNPLFDLVNAPFTHPIGTELAMICIDNAWNGYDTLVKELIGELEEGFPKHPNITALKNAMSLKNNLPTDQRLGILRIAPDWKKICECIALHSDKFHVKAEQAQRTFELAKKLRTMRAHLFGEPTSKLLSLIDGQSFADYNVRLLDGELEVTLVFSRNVIEVVGLRAHAIYSMAQGVYGLERHVGNMGVDFTG